MRFRTIILTNALAGALLTPAAMAAPTVYTDRASFNAAVTGQTTYGFEEFAGLGGGLLIEPPTYTKGGVTFTAAGTGLYGFDDAYNAPYLGDDGGGAFTISTLAGGIGLYLGDFFNAQTVSYTFGSLTGTLNIPRADDTTFFGLTNDGGPISVTFSNADEIDVPQFVSVRSSEPCRNLLPGR